jgi:LuxR family transcriptional regulator, glucitol operon activator
MTSTHNINDMIINNRRDAGYTIISRFEEDYREFLHDKLTCLYSNFLENIPQGIVSKAIERHGSVDWDDSSDFFENIDFPDLKEISISKDHFHTILNDFMEKFEYSDAMNELYALRCKIAHVKGYFTSIDLDKLIELTDLIGEKLDFSDFVLLLNKIKTDPNSVIIKIPSDFIEDYLGRSGIIHNLPVPDYEYEGGFVGRDEDRKKIIQLLQSEKFSVITLTGSGGVGKTSLALKVIQDITERPESNIFDAIVWLSAKENRLSALGIEDIEPTLKNFEELLDTIIDLFGFRSELLADDIQSKENLVSNLFDLTKKVLIIIDNLETITDQRIINFIFDAPIKVKFLVTSRRGIGQLEIRHELKELKAKEAVYLFRQLAKDKQLPKLLQLSDDVIKNYTSKVSFYPLAIKWVIGQVAKGKDINKIIESIHTTDSDISKFCYEQIFGMLSDYCKKVLYTLSLLDNPPTASILQYIIELEDQQFEDSINELILVSLVIPEHFQNDNKEISTKYLLLPLTKGYTRIQLNKKVELREYLNNRINEVENTVTTTERAKKEYKHSLYNFGAKSDEEKVATIIAQTAFQKYQTGLYDAAVDDYKRAQKIAPNFAPIYRNWALMESYENHLSEADKLMEKAASLDPEDPQIFLIWGNIYRKGSKHSESSKKYTMAYNLAPNDPIILNAFGQAKSRLGDFEEADKLLTKAIQCDSAFSSVKHEVINRTSLAENLINWSDYLSRDRNYGEAEKKLNSALTHCTVALEANARDPKIFSTLSKVNLKRGLLYFHMKLDRKAIEALSAVINSHAQYFKHSLFKLSALIELGEYYNSIFNSNELKRIIKIVDTEYSNSQILKRIEYKSLQERLNRLRENYQSDDRKNGVIIEVNINRGFVIIQDSAGVDTYLGHKSKFIPAIEYLGFELKETKVSFTPFIISDEENERKQAIKIKITGANTQYSKKR